jgi:type II secretion system protein H
LSRSGPICFFSNSDQPTSSYSARYPSFIPQKSSKNSQGFSLVEILVAIVVLSIVTGLAVVSLGPMWQKHLLKQATGQMIGQIQTYRMKAILERRTYQIKISGQALSHRYKTGLDWSSWEQTVFTESIKISMSGTSYFYSKGFASPKTITVMQGVYHQKIIININGRARTSEIY